jgi:hypothetical protein
MDNTSGHKVHNNPNTNFLIDVEFTSERDAVLFKLFWL